MSVIEKARNLTGDFLNFVNKGLSPYHVVQESKERLEKVGFTQLHEGQNWKLVPGGKYYLIRSNSTLLAFTVGKKFDANNTGFKIIGAHTDSPCLRLAPLSQATNQNFRQTCVCTYGGGLWHTWFDRDLVLAGRVVYKTAEGEFKTTLYNSERPILKIPNLAIHLTPQDERGKFAPNTETHLKPVLSSEVYEKLSNTVVSQDAVQNAPLKNNHYAGLLLDISKKTGIPVDNIIDLDLCFADSQPATVVGINEEFISSPRLDNLFSSWAALVALTKPEVNQEIENSSYINVICLFDHEECGSESFQGAGSTLLLQTIDRVFKLLSATQANVDVDSLHKTYINSFFVSADMAHSIHPNYPEKHKENHRIKINEGIGLKINHNQRYTTDSVSASLIKSVASKAQIPIQEFVVKNDSPCGSTIGPIVSPNTGIKACDIGAPQWGMHSIRETCGVVDSYYYVELMSAFFLHYETIAPTLLQC
ncbi:aspartyl aminopeptidase (macronuclear) [Tetrahymena thermophila SB210]|uniref:aspartyl aminopeptidase n=1 Tax=Tetrahymena thermophila (strain SB210) TaxID=312017 RepID=Q22Y34_TETTS|nr:aspartyl aminopeptidase [Tetrahymena thermophila SB210]EAR90190.1 aspartyl aminopeptidase [Tetrahymena thermophila SB210]|eukprot:XP_001010435.1 aspartyl aminopeptidase [Tetrahymena thermophila SB210]